MRGHGLTFSSDRPPRRMVCGAVALSAVAFFALAFAATGSAAVPCRDRVIADWSDNGRVDHAYPLACYRDAVTHLPEDLRTYSSAPDDIRQALSERRSPQRHTQRVAARHRAPAAVASPSNGPPLAVIVPAVAGLLTLLSVASWFARDRWRSSR